MTLLYVDFNSFLMLGFGSVMTILASVAGYQIKKYFKRIEKSGRLRERKQESYYMKLDAVIYALAISSDNIYGQVFQKAYNDKLVEFENERNRIEFDN